MAHETSGRSFPTRALSLALAVAVAALAASAAAALDVRLEAYRNAASAGASGTLTGLVHQERRRPDGPDEPMAGVAVLLVPHSRGFLERLEEIRQGARDSAIAYRRAATSIRGVRDAYERALWEAGASDLARASASGADGRFTFEHLPAGEWILLAIRSEFVERASPRASRRDRSTFAPRTRLVGYEAVSVWLREVSVAGRRRASVTLTDRDVWFSGVVEERELDAGP
jgi:hypothetical protein